MNMSISIVLHYLDIIAKFHIYYSNLFHVSKSSELTFANKLLLKQ
jgi:hypothetical protein